MKRYKCPCCGEQWSSRERQKLADEQFRKDFQRLLKRMEEKAKGRGYCSGFGRGVAR